MTINELLALTGLTGSDEIPVWDAEASGEPTKKITAQNFAAAIKTLASLLGTGDVVNDLTSTATNKPGSANMLKTLNDSKVSCTELISVSNMSEGTTYTIPDAIKNSKIVIISFRRYGYFASIAASYYALDNGANTGTIAWADNSSRYVTFSVNAGVLKIVHDGLGSPTMELIGIG